MTAPQTGKFWDLIELHFVCLLFLVCCNGILHAQTVRGQVRNAISFQPITSASVRIQGSAYIAATDIDGRFVIPDVRPGRYRIIAQHIQYASEYRDVQVSSSKDLVLEILMEPRIDTLPEATVHGTVPSRHFALYQITEEETRLYPGTFFDPGRFAASFPGTQVSNDQANQLIINGLHPDLMKWQIEGLEIVNPNHLSNAGALSDRPTLTGGGVNMLSNQMLANSTLYTGVLPIDKGNALSGVMDMRFHQGNAAKREHTVQIGLLGLDAATEGPFKNGSQATYLVNFRYSTVGLLQKLGVDFGDERIAFYDFSFNLNFPTGKTGGEVSAFWVNGRSTNDLSPKPEQEWEEDRDRSEVNFHEHTEIVGLTWHQPIGKTSGFKAGAAFSYHQPSRSERRAGLPGRYRSEGSEAQKIAFRSAFQTAIGLRALASVGLQILNASYRANRFFKDAYDSGSDGEMTLIRPYTDWKISLSEKMTLQMGMGFAYLEEESSGQLEPLVFLQIQTSTPGQIGIGYRVSHQAPVQYYNTNGMGVTNRSVDLVGAHSLELTYAQNLARGIFDVSLFYHNIRTALVGAHGFAVLNLSDITINFPLTDNGEGRAYGVNVGYRKSFLDDYFLAANVSVFRSRYTDLAGVERPTTFDTGHAAYVAGGREWTSARDYGTRTFGATMAVIHNGGLKEPVIDQQASLEADRTIYRDDTFGDVQLDAYFRADVRLYLRKDKGGKSTTWSLDIQNLTNRENAWLSVYDFLNQEVRQGTQLGIIPILSYRVDF